jgi:hypothetical protein
MCSVEPGAKPLDGADHRRHGTRHGSRATEEPKDAKTQYNFLGRVSVRTGRREAAIPTDERFRFVFERLAEAIPEYDVDLVLCAVPPPYRGDLDGSTIQIDDSLSAEERVFLAVHLFGHTVQWNLNPRAREIGSLVQQSPDDAMLAELTDYERTACRYGQHLLHEVGVRDLDSWLADFAAADSKLLLHFYRTGERRPVGSFWQVGQPLLSPLQIPPFEPRTWKLRRLGIVV